jgi:hypothetical protein
LSRGHDFAVIHLKIGIVSNRKFDHCQALLRGGAWYIAQRRTTGGDETNLIQAELLQRFFT